MPRITALLMLHSTLTTISAPASRPFRGSIAHPTQPLCTLRVRRRRRLTQHSLPGGLLGLTRAGLAPADRASFAWRLLSNSPTRQRYAGPSLGAGAGVGPYSLSFPPPRMREVARQGRMPWISPGRPGCYRATSRKRPSASLRGCTSASWRATRQSTAYRLLRLLDLTAPYYAAR